MCKICGFKDTPYQIGKVLYHYCPNCGFLSKPESLILSSEKEKARYDLHHNEESLDYFLYQEAFFKMIEPYLGNLSLDFGCGKSHMLSNVLSKYHYNSFYYDLYYFDNKEVFKEIYDSIILEEVIEHLKNPLEVLKDLLKNLKQGGFFIIRTNLYSDLAKLKCWWYLRDTTHISFFNLKTFKEISKLLNLKLKFSNNLDIIVLEKL